jgi:hypothetical protein
MPEGVARRSAAAERLPCRVRAALRRGGIGNGQDCALTRRDGRSQPCHQLLPVGDMSVAAVSTALDVRPASALRQSACARHGLYPLFSYLPKTVPNYGQRFPA